MRADRRTDGQADMTKLEVVFRGFANSPKNYSFHKTTSMRHNVQFNIALKKRRLVEYTTERNKQIGGQSKLHFRQCLLLSKAWNIFGFIIKPLSGINYICGREEIRFTQKMLIKNTLRSVLFLWRRNSPSRPRPPHFRGMKITLRHTKLLWTSDQPDAQTTTWRHTTLTTDRHPCPRQDSNLQSHLASGCRPTP